MERMISGRDVALRFVHDRSIETADLRFKLGPVSMGESVRAIHIPELDIYIDLDADDRIVNIEFLDPDVLPDWLLTLDDSSAQTPEAK